MRISWLIIKRALWALFAIVCAGLVGGTMLAVGCNYYGSLAVTAFLFLLIFLLEGVYKGRKRVY